MLAGVTKSGRSEVSRYHIIKEIEELTERSGHKIRYAEFMCGMANMRIGKRFDVVELADGSDACETEAPVCKSCLKRAAGR